MKKLRDLPGLGPKSEAQLFEIGIFTPDDLKATGAIEAFIKLKKECSVKPSLNFLYALAGAIEGEHWLKVAKKERGRLLMALEGYAELEKILSNEGIDIKI